MSNEYVYDKKQVSYEELLRHLDKKELEETLKAVKRMKKDKNKRYV